MRRVPLFSAILAVPLACSTAFAASPVAVIYAQTPTGIHEYAVSSKGLLTEIEYSPDTNTQGAMVGSNKSYFVTVDSQVLHLYTLASNGRIASQSWFTDTQSNPGSECGTVGGAVLDHTGRDIYVLLNGNGTCAVFQTYTIGQFGSLSYAGATGDVSHGLPAATLPTLTGNSKFAFDAPEYSPNWTSPSAGCNPYLDGFTRDSSGVLQYSAPTAEVSGPKPGQNGNQLLPVPWLMTDDPTDHLAVAVFNTDGAPCGNGGPVQLASFTVSSKGALTSTNTAADMPTVPGGARSMMLNKAGNVLAVATGTGIELFHFNGAKSITKFTGIIGTSGYISRMSWDTSNHLYALNGASGRLHVYDVTSSGIKEAAGSPYLPPGGATGLIVVSY